MSPLKEPSVLLPWNDCISLCNSQPDLEVLNMYKLNASEHEISTAQIN